MIAVVGGGGCFGGFVLVLCVLLVCMCEVGDRLAIQGLYLFFEKRLSRSCYICSGVFE
jgi:hypothetical protein